MEGIFLMTPPQTPPLSLRNFQSHLWEDIVFNMTETQATKLITSYNLTFHTIIDQTVFTAEKNEHDS